MSIDPDTVAELRLQLEGAVEECQALVRDNERLEQELAEARLIGNTLIVENAALKAEIERLRKALAHEQELWAALRQA